MRWRRPAAISGLLIPLSVQPQSVVVRRYAVLQIWAELRHLSVQDQGCPFRHVAEPRIPEVGAAFEEVENGGFTVELKQRFGQRHVRPERIELRRTWGLAGSAQLLL